MVSDRWVDAVPSLGFSRRGGDLDGNQYLRRPCALFKHGELVEEAISRIPNVQNHAQLAELLRLSEEVVIDLLYFPEFARRRLYFRRVRIPPLLGVYWHHIFVAHSLKKMLKHFVGDGETCIRTGHAAMVKIKRMRGLALECHLPEEDIEYMEYTFGIIALAREYFFRPFDEGIKKRLEKAKKKYKKRYPKGTRFRYTVKLDFTPFKTEPTMDESLLQLSRPASAELPSGR